MAKEKSKLVPHVGMRKLKSLLSLFVGFWAWQLVRLFLPELEVHPLYIYIYCILEIRDSSEKTVSFGKRRLKATFISLVIGLLFVLLSMYLKSLTGLELVHIAIELAVILVGALIVLCVTEMLGCENFCGVGAAIFVILLACHADDESLLYAVLRASQTAVGVVIAWVINVKLFPYPRKKAKEETESAEKTTN